MGRLKQYQAGFTVGELDPLLRGRIDLQQYYSSVALADNVLFEPQGGFSRRPGLRFVTDLTADNPANGVLLIPFEFSTTQNFMIVASVFNASSTLRLRFYANQTLLTGLNQSFTITVTDYANIAVGAALVFKLADGTAHTLTALAGGSGSATDTTGVTRDFRPHTSNDVTAQRLAAAIDAIDGFTAPVPGANVVTVQRDTPATANLAVTTSDGTRLAKTDFTNNSYLDFPTGTLYETSAIDMDKTYFTQSADTLIVVNEDFAPFSVVRGANNSTWTIAALSLTPPKSLFTAVESNPNATLTPSAVSGTITLTASSSVFTTDHIDQYITDNTDFGRARIISRNSGTVVTAVTEVPFFSTSAIASGAWTLQTGHETAWSNNRGWPRTTTFHEGRLWFGGSASEPATLWGSKVAQYFNFKGAEGLDDDAIAATLITDSVNAITAMRSGRDLQIFTTGAEFFVPQANLDPITPGNITIKSATRRGSKLGIRPQAAEGGTLFIQRQGKAVREMLFSDVELSYVANNISLLSSHMLVDPQRMALRPATDTTEGDLLMVVNGTDTTGFRASSVGFAGSISAYMLNRPQQIVAPASWTTDGDFVDVAVDLDTIYTVVKRTVGSATKYYLETFDDDRTTDAAVQYYANPVAPDQAVPSNTTAGGLAHLEGKTVKVIRDDLVDSDGTVSSGNVTLGGVPQTYAEVGLNFDITVKTQPFEPRMASGSQQSQKRRILEVTPLLFKTQNITLNGKDINLAQGALSGSGAVTAFTGPRKTMGFRGYDRDAQITISQSQPLFMTVLSLDFKVSVGG